MKLGSYSEGTYELLAPGERRIQLTGLEQRDTNPEFIEYDEKGVAKNPFRWKWSFVVIKGDSLGESFNIWTNATINKGSTAAPIVEALLGRALQPGEELDSDMIIDKQIDCYISDKGPKGGNKNVIVNPRAADGKTAPTQTLTQELEATDTLSPLLEGTGLEVPPGEAAGYPRRMWAAKKALIGRGVSVSALEERQATVAQSETPFKSLTTKEQKAVVDWFESWVSDPESYDESGDVNF